MRCLDLRVLDDRVSFRTTRAGLFSISDSEFALSFDSDDLLASDDDFGVIFLGIDFLFGGDESALVSLSESLKITHKIINETTLCAQK